MNNDRPRRRFVGTDTLLSGAVFEVKTFRKLEVELDRGALEGTTERIANGNVDFGTVKRAISRINVPFTWVVLV